LELMSTDTMPDVPAAEVVGYVNSLLSWEEVSRGSQLRLPIAGHEYVIPHPSYSTTVALAAEGGPDWSNEEFLTRLLGDQLDQMRADDVPNAAIVHAALVAHADVTRGREVALAMWRYGMDPDRLVEDIRKRTAAQPTAKPAKKPATKAAKKPARKV
jgi:hypothetical protein